MIFMNSYTTRFRNIWIKWMLTAVFALGVWLLTPVAHAECSADSECYTAREAQACLVCLTERERLRAVAKKKEDERNEAIAQQNILSGRASECRVQRDALDLERLQWRDTARNEAKKPSWWTVVGVGLGAVLIGGVMGAATF